MRLADGKITIVGLTAAVALSLGACAGNQNGSGSAAGPVDIAPLSNYEVAVTETEEVLEIKPTGWMLDSATKRALDGFARTYVTRGNGMIMMTAPAGSENADMAYQTATAVRSFLRERGVNDAMIMAEMVDATGQSMPGITLKFASSEATAPDCGGFDDMTKSYHNTTSRNFGCATAANMAAMIANPRDLVEPREFEAGRADRTTLGTEMYTAGEVETTTASTATDGGGQ